MFCALTHIWGCGQCTIRRTVCTVIILHHYAILVCCNAFKGIYFTQGVVLSMQENDSTALWCTALHWWCWKLYCTAMWLSALHCNAESHIALHCFALHCIALHCTVLMGLGWDKGSTPEKQWLITGHTSPWVLTLTNIFPRYIWKVHRKYMRSNEEIHKKYIRGT